MMSLFLDQNVLIIAEVSANHGQDFDRAVEMIKQAKACGATAVKFQAYTPETLTIDSNKKYFQIQHPIWGGQTMYQLYTQAFTPLEWLEPLKKIADDLGIIFLCSVFDKSGVDLLEKLNVCTHKIASPELVDLALIEHVASTQKPLIISTGMGDIDEIRMAIDTATRAGAENIILLKCVSNYPANPEHMNLKTIPHMKKLFQCPVGLSDHTLGIGASICAVSLGAQVIEKHFTLSRKIETPDAFFSIEISELKELVDNIRLVEKSLGNVSYELFREEKAGRIYRRSLFAVENIQGGETLTHTNIKSIRPAHGLNPRHLKTILGRTAKQDISRGTPITWDLIF